MTNHFELAKSLIVTADIIKETVDGELAAKRKTAEDLTRITRHKEDLRHVTSMAKLHTGMAQVQSLDDLRAVIEQLAKDLNAEPSASFEAHALAALELVDGPERWKNP